jgi:hypothetical protein
VAGDANSFSATTDVIADPTPRNMGGAAAPRLSGGAAVGFPMTAAPGSWDGPLDVEIAFTYAWYSCSAAGADTPATLPLNCSLISGETGAAFSPTRTQNGKHIRVGVTASNGRGSGVRFSATLGPVGSGPTNTAAPTISGTVSVASQLTAANGTWGGIIVTELKHAGVPQWTDSGGKYWTTNHNSRMKMLEHLKDSLGRGQLTHLDSWTIGEVRSFKMNDKDEPFCPRGGIHHGHGAHDDYLCPSNH